MNASDNSLKFRLNYYHDTFNVELGKRFMNSYRMDILKQDEPILTLISNNKGGTLISTEIVPITYESKFMKTWDTVFINGKPEVFYRFQSFGISRWFSNKKTVRFQNGLTVKLKITDYLFDQTTLFDYFDGKNPVCRFSSETRQKRFRAPADFSFVGDIELFSEISTLHLIFLLDFARQETMASNHAS